MSWQNETTARPATQQGAPSSRELLELLYVPGQPLPITPATPLGRTALALGRGVSGPDSLCLRDPAASRRHARIAPDPSGRRLIDESTNGTTVNGARITEHALADGDVIRIGDTLLLYRLVPTDLRDGEVPELLGRAPAISALRHAITRAGPTTATVLVLGESGCGKELVARALHQTSGRHGPFVPVNCSAIPHELAESELFGHAAGAFTGARRDHPGYFRAAEGGTLFLDELGDLPLALQPKLLRVLEERAVRPIGTARPIPCDVRVIAATHRDLPRAVREGAFRGDLYARLAEVKLFAPALRERREDVLPLFARALGDDGRRIAPDLAERLVLHTWPFNVREIEKVARELSVLVDASESLVARHVDGRLFDVDTSGPPSFGVHRKDERRGDGAASASSRSDRRAEPPSREELARLLEKHRGTVSAVAQELDRSRRQIRRYIEAFGLDVEQYRKG